VLQDAGSNSEVDVKGQLQVEGKFYNCNRYNADVPNNTGTTILTCSVVVDFSGDTIEVLQGQDRGD
jgi:hypothetical protein